MLTPSATVWVVEGSHCTIAIYSSKLGAQWHVAMTAARLGRLRQPPDTRYIRGVLFIEPPPSEAFLRVRPMTVDCTSRQEFGGWGPLC